MTPDTHFALPAHLAEKARADLVAGDERQFAAISASLAETVAGLTERLAGLRQAPVRAGQEVLERDLEVHRLTARLRVLRRYAADLALGRMTDVDGSRTYVGRVGLRDADGNHLLVDWRSPAAEPFFAATTAEPTGLTSRRRYRWSQGQVVDYWDEVLTADHTAKDVAPDEDSALLASLARSRTPRCRTC